MEKKRQEEGRVRQWTEVRCQKGESRSGYKKNDTEGGKKRDVRRRYMKGNKNERRDMSGQKTKKEGKAMSTMFGMAEILKHK